MLPPEGTNGFGGSLHFDASLLDFGFRDGRRTLVSLKAAERLAGGVKVGTRGLEGFLSRLPAFVLGLSEFSRGTLAEISSGALRLFRLLKLALRLVAAATDVFQKRIRADLGWIDQ